MKKLGKTEKSNYRIRFNFPFGVGEWRRRGVRLSKSKSGFFSMSGTATLLSKYGSAATCTNLLHYRARFARVYAPLQIAQQPSSLVTKVKVKVGDPYFYVLKRGSSDTLGMAEILLYDSVATKNVILKICRTSMKALRWGQ